MFCVIPGLRCFSCAWLCLAVGVDRKKAKACRGEEPKDVRWEERGLGDPFVGDRSSTRTYTPLAQFGCAVQVSII